MLRSDCWQETLKSEYRFNKLIATLREPSQTHMYLVVTFKNVSAVEIRNLLRMHGVIPPWSATLFWTERSQAPSEQRHFVSAILFLRAWGRRDSGYTFPEGRVVVSSKWVWGREVGATHVIKKWFKLISLCLTFHSKKILPQTRRKSDIPTIFMVKNKFCHFFVFVFVCLCLFVCFCFCFLLPFWRWWCLFWLTWIEGTNSYT